MATTAEQLRLDGKVAVVTGGGTGLGKTMALAFARAGAAVAVAGRRLEPLEQTASAIRSAGGRALVLQTDVSRPEQVHGAVQRVLADLGGLHILVNNAGALKQYFDLPLLEITPAQWREAISGELDGAFFFSQEAARPMVKEGYGRIINLGSAMAVTGMQQTTMYNVAKAGIMELTRIFAMALGGKGVTTNCIAPGLHSAGGWMERDKGEQQDKEDWLDVIASGRFSPVGHIGDPEGIGALAVLLASQAASYINGTTIFVDGGVVMGRYAPLGYVPEHPLPPELAQLLAHTTKEA